MKNYWEMTPTERWEEDQRQLDESDPYRSSRPLFRDAQGNVVQGGQSPSPPGEKVDAETWKRMTYPERVAYARQFPQST